MAAKHRWNAWSQSTDIYGGLINWARRDCVDCGLVESVRLRAVCDIR